MDALLDPGQLYTESVLLEMSAIDVTRDPVRDYD